MGLMEKHHSNVVQLLRRNRSFRDGIEVETREVREMDEIVLERYHSMERASQFIFHPYLK